MAPKLLSGKYTRLDKRTIMPLATLTDEQVREAAYTACRLKGNIRRLDRSVNLEVMNRAELIKYINSLAPVRSKCRLSPGKPRMAKNKGVGRYCKELLRRVIGTVEGTTQPIGLSYKQMVSMAQRKFPDSAVDERHLRWYATAMRAEGEMIPVHRKRSSWV